MTKCSANKCSNSTQNGYHLFCFPSRNKDSRRRDVWVKKVGEHVTNDSKLYRLCECHFEDSQFALKKKRRSKNTFSNRLYLKNDAVPTLKLCNDQPERKTTVTFTKDVYLDHTYAKGMTTKVDSKDIKIQLQAKQIMNLSRKLKEKYVKLHSANKEVRRLKKQSDHMRNNL